MLLLAISTGFLKDTILSGDLKEDMQYISMDHYTLRRAREKGIKVQVLQLSHFLDSKLVCSLNRMINYKNIPYRKKVKRKYSQ